MATDPKVSDDTQWPGLLTDANNGTLSMADGAAEKCAQHCETLLEAVLGMRSWIQSNDAPLPPYSSLSSGAQLATTFNRKYGTELTARLERHANILTDMGNTFVAAGKAYQAAEESSAASFAGIDFDNPPPTIPTYKPKAQTPPTVTGNPGTPDLNGDSVMADVTIPAENPDSLSWGDLYNVGQSIDAQAVADQAGTWQWMSNTLSTAFKTFVQQINTASSSWSGAGARTAITASTNYGTDAHNLTTDMAAVGDILTYTSGWLQETKENMPVSPVPPPTNVPVSIDGVSYDVSTGLAIFRQNFSNVYAVGLGQTTSHVPALPQPYTANSLEPKQQSGPTGPTGSSGGQTGGDGAGATGASSAAATGSVQPFRESVAASLAPGQATPGTSALSDPAAQTTSALSQPAAQTMSPLSQPAAQTTSAPSQPATQTTSALSQPAAQTMSPLSQPAAQTTSAPSQPAATTSALTTPAATTSATNPLSSLSSLLPSTAGAAALPNSDVLANAAKAEKQALAAATKDAAGKLGGAAAKLGGGAGGGGGEAAGVEGAPLARDSAESSKLFPRASASMPEEELGRAGAAEEPGAGAEGPMGGGGGAGRGGNQDKDKKRAGYLDSREHLDEAIGDVPVAVRPILDR